MNKTGQNIFWLLFILSSPLFLNLAHATQVTLSESPGIIKGQSNSHISEIEGTVEWVRPKGPRQLDLLLSSETGRVLLVVEEAHGQSPERFSRVRATGIQSIGEAHVDGQSIPEMKVPELGMIKLLTGSLVAVATNVAQMRELQMHGQVNRFVASLEGLVLAASPESRFIAFQDQSGAAMLEMEHPAVPINAGEKITLAGNATAKHSQIQFNNPALVNNDGLHTMTERSGSIFLKSGKIPFHLSWFNLENPRGLEVFYEGPGVRRQNIPNTILGRNETDSTSGNGHWTNGLDYQCYEGSWLRVPDFDLLTPVKEGITANFNLDVISRETYVGMKFSGRLDIPRDGIYTFTTVSDDGSLLFIDGRPPSVEQTGTQALPEPVKIAPGQVKREDQPDQWSMVEGTVTFASRKNGGLVLVLSSPTGRIDIEIADGNGSSPLLFLHSRLRVVGICRSTLTTDGQSVAGEMQSPGLDQIELLEAAAEHWTDAPLVPIRELPQIFRAPSPEILIRVRAKSGAPESNGFFSVEDGTVRLLVQPLKGAAPAIGDGVEILGSLTVEGTNFVLKCACERPLAPAAAEGTNTLPMLTKVEEIKHLTRSEWTNEYPVKIRGVVTSVLDSGFFIHDSTGSIYARWQPLTGPETPQVGDFMEIEGVTFAEFAPNIRVQNALRLGQGTLPEPLHPNWDQLINGSLDTEYVEVQGVVTLVDPLGVTLLTRAGKISMELPDQELQFLKHCDGALIRIRGCVIPMRDINSQQVELGRIRLSNTLIMVDEPAPEDPFNIPSKHASDLFLFDSKAGSLRRIKIQGQIIHQNDGEYYLMDGASGLRFNSTNVVLNLGDVVEVVGFPELGGPSPVLREAVARRISHAELPAPEDISGIELLGTKHDGTLVRLPALLTGISKDRTDHLLEMQAGAKRFVARLKATDGSLRGILPGSMVELTGVYRGMGGDLATGKGFNSFDLLLNSPLDIRVLTRPPWWTMGRALTALGAMSFVILIAIIWITLLRLQVEKRSLQLATEVQRREHTERQRELEKERARIARDLHDDLGATLTQIRFLSALESRDAKVPEGTRGRMGKISEKSREMVASLDEIVWAVNPTNDCLASLANYLCHFAVEFFSPTPVQCRLDVDDVLPAAPLTSEVRHNIYLAVREGLNNISKHSRAAEVWLRIQMRQSLLCISIEDDGCGFSLPAATATGEGLANMQKRLESIGGRFEIITRPGAGTVCKLWLPMDKLINAGIN